MLNLINFHNMHCAWFFCYRPAGWDSMKKISILYDNMQTIRPDEFYNSVITKVNTRKVCTVWNFTQTFCFINHVFFLGFCQRP